MDLDQLLEEVNSKATLLRFIDALRQDKADEDQKEQAHPSPPYSSGANGWENDTIPDFLEAMGAYGEDTDELTPDWKSFARLLYAGKYYE